MKDSRIGESLWFLWDVEEPVDGSLSFYTEEHVDIEHDVVRKALASALQREGITYSLGQSYSLLERAEVEHGYSGLSPLGDQNGWPCNEHGETEDGYILDFVTPATWVKVFNLD
jgi:hypothetical protein